MIKNKKAFTLIEVLAIIVVLAIIALIAIPNINGYVNQTREQAFETSVDSLIRAYQYKSIDDGNLGRLTPCDLSYHLRHLRLMDMLNHQVRHQIQSTLMIQMEFRVIEYVSI